MDPRSLSYYSRLRSRGVLNGAGDGEVGLLAGGGCARRGKRQRSDASILIPGMGYFKCVSSATTRASDAVKSAIKRVSMIIKVNCLR